MTAHPRLLALLAPVAPVALCAALLGGCSGGGDDSPGEPAGSASPADPAAEAAAVDELCGVFETASQAFRDNSVALPEEDTDLVPAALAEALKQWGADLAAADLPADLSDAQRDGIGIMSRLLLDMPEDPMGQDLEAFDEQLSDSDDDKVAAATGWVEDTCGIDL